MTDRKLRVGIIGMGAWAASHHVPELRATGRAEVVAASRRNADRLALAKRDLGIPATYTDWRTMLVQAALDAVVVCTPHNQHVEPTLAALKGGLHVLLEKPLATSVADAQSICLAAHRSNRVVMMGVNRRGQRSWRTIHQLLASGQIGRVRQLSAVMCADLRIFREDQPLSLGLSAGLNAAPEAIRVFTLDIPREGAWRRDPRQMGGDMFADTGSHTVDLMLWLADAPAVEVMAYMPRDRPQQAAIVTLQALLANDAVLSISFNDNVAMGDDFDFRSSGRLTIYGDRGMLEAQIPFGGGGLNEVFIQQNGERQAVAVEDVGISPAAAFVDAICDGAPNMATVDDAARVVAFTQAAYQSAAERRPVRLV